VNRRHVLLAGAVAAALPVTPVLAQDANSQAALMADGAPFEREKLIAYARDLAKRAYVAPNPALPDGFRDLNFEAYLNIKNRRERAVWSENARGFLIEPLHRGFIYQAPVSVAVVEGGLVRKIVYNASSFDFGRLTPPPPNVADMGFSGFRVLSAVGEGAPREIALFQGASFIRGKARGQTFGSISRSLSLKTADPRGEEFPFFRAFWIEQPTRDDTLVIHALLDSESVAGVYTFTMRVSDVTLIDTEAVVFPRVPLDSFGIAGMQGTFFLGFTERRIADDYRPQVADATGLQLVAGNGEWIWRPLANPKALQISAFSTERPKGFGLVMRDRDFASWQDVDARFELRPTLWMEPIGDWGPGSLQLVEIPSDNEIHDNVIAQWRPKEPLAAGGEFLFAYRQHFTWWPPERPPVATVAGTRIGRGPQRRRRFYVDFVGDRLKETPVADMTTAIWASNNGIKDSRIVPGGDGRPFRVIFDLDAGNEALVELRLALMAQNAQISETWLYRWTP
jgi:glucans biosynthesis protein